MRIAALLIDFNLIKPVDAFIYRNTEAIVNHRVLCVPVDNNTSVYLSFHVARRKLHLKAIIRSLLRTPFLAPTQMWVNDEHNAADMTDLRVNCFGG